MLDTKVAVERFAELSDIACAGLKEALTSINRDIAPDESLMQGISTSLHELREVYDTVKNSASSIDADDGNDAAFHRYIEAIESDEARRMREAIQPVIDLLERFVNVTSDKEAFSSALRPAQDEMQAVLAEIASTSDASNASSFGPDDAVFKPGLLFMDALAHDDLTDDRGIELTDELYQLFQPRVVGGLLSHVYYEPSQAEKPVTIAPDQESQAPVTPKPDQTSEPEATAQDVKPETIIAPKPGDEMPASSTRPVAPPPATRVSYPLTPALEKKHLGLKALKRDVVKPFMARLVFSLLASWPGLSISQLQTFISCLDVPVCNIDKIALTLDSLTKAGYLESSDMPDGGEPRYCLAPEAVDLCKKESVYNLKDAGHNLVWPFPLPDRSNKRSAGIASIDSRYQTYALTSPQELTGLYDLLISYGKYRQAHGHSRGELTSWVANLPESVSVRQDGGGSVTCQLVPDAMASIPPNGNILSNYVPESDFDLGPYDHWFALMDGTLEDIVKPQPDTSSETDSEPAEEAEGVQLQSEPIPEDEPEEISLASNEPGPTPAKSCPAPIEPPGPIPAENPDAHSKAADDTQETLPGDAKQMARAMAEHATCPTDEEALQFVDSVFADTRPEDAADTIGFVHTFLKSVSDVDGHPQAAELSSQIAYACDSPLEKHPYTGSDLGLAFKSADFHTRGMLQLASYCRAMLTPQTPYDYDLHAACAACEGQSYEAQFPDLGVVKPLYNELLRVWDLAPQGLTRQIIESLGGETERNRAIDELKTEARRLAAAPRVKAMITGIPEFLESCFGEQSDLGRCIGIIAADSREETEEVKNVLAKFSDDRTHEVAPSTIEETIDSLWRDTVSNKKNKKMKLEYEARRTVITGFEDRLRVMQDWLDYVSTTADTSTIEQLGALRDALASLVDETASAGAQLAPVDAAVLKLLLHDFSARLRNGTRCLPNFGQFLLTGFVSLSDNLPALNKNLAQVRYCEPWRNVLRHYAAPVRQPDELMKLISSDGDSDIFDNLGQLRGLIARYGLPEKVLNPSVSDIRGAEKTAEDALKKFNDHLEMAYAYNKIDEDQKEWLSEVARSNKQYFFDIEDFAAWSHFLDGLKRQVDDCAQTRGKTLEDRLAVCETRLNGTSSTLLDKARSMYDAGNFAVVEEYLNRLDNGSVNLDAKQVSETDNFSEFISPSTYGTLFNYCQQFRGNHSRPFSKFAGDYLKGNYPEGWATRQKENAQAMVDNWPRQSRGIREEDADVVSRFLRYIGISVKTACRLSSGRAHYRVETRPTSCGLTQYSHPIAAFGTQLARFLDVLVLFGRTSPREILSVVADEKMTSMSVVIVDSPMRLEEKRELAELSYKSSNHLQFIVIDQVLALYLALHEQVERLPLALKCALPFTFYQPFVRDGGPTPDEMFCGRDSELASIMDSGGASVVYGGRQLGKTALLQRAESLCQEPEKNRYAVYLNILECRGEDEVAQRVADGIRAKTQLPIEPVSNLRELCAEIERIMKLHEGSRLLLLLDECDNFLKAISDSDYMPLKPLVDLMRTCNAFKFVLAGLHNVCRAKNAIANNGVFGQLGSPLCVKPLSPMEALQLISRPLLFLGFQVDRYPHLETILANTNYYPGIIQFFGHILVQTTKEQYGQYYRAVDGQPPYPLHEEQLGAIISQNDLNNSIKEKFRLSLELDPRYFMLARCIAMLYFSAKDNGNQRSLLDGFNVDVIQAATREYDMELLKGESTSSLLTLLDEMVEMGILSKPASDQRSYKLRRYSFLNIIGQNADAVLTDIIEANDVAARMMTSEEGSDDRA